MLNHNDKSALQAQGINIIDSTDSKEHFEEQFKAFLQHNAKEVLKENHIDLKALSYFLGIDENLANMQGYELTFTGKGLANALYNTPCQKELKHKETFYDSSNTNACHSEGAKATEESQKETSHLTQNDKSNLAQNSIIIGDNLDALKILKSAYSQKIKMIYIDPPYNTGKDDFIYPDDFRADYKEILKEVGLLEINENGEAIESQTLKFFKSITSSRSHSGWLSFMLPRLKLARDLLKDDGVIFISIDDNEQANLKLLCDEIFGEENFVACLMWRKIEENASSGGTMKQTKTFRKDHEYILCYAKTQGEFLTKKYMELPNFEGNYKNLDNDPRGAFKAGSISMKGNKKSAKYYEVTTPSGKKYARVWRITKDEFDELDKDNRIYYGKKQDSVPQIKIFLNEERPVTPKTIFENLGSAYEASENLKKMFQIPIDNEPIFDSPKPVELIKRILEVSTSPNPANNALDSAGGGDYKPHSLNASHCEARSNEAIQDSKEWIATNATHSRNDKGGDSKAEGDIVLDFFAGSGTTAQAVMELNAEDGGNRQFILVQLDEKIDEAKSKTAYDFCKNQLGSKNPAISDITIERVKRAAQKIKNTQDSNTESSFCVYSLKSKPEIINKEGHLHLKMSNSLTPFDKARNLALQSGKTLDKPLKAIIESRLYKCEDSYYIVNYEKSLLAYLQKAENVFVFISAYEEIALEDFLNLEVSSKERLYVVY